MPSIHKYRSLYRKQSEKYTKIAFKRFKAHFKKMGKSIKFDQMTTTNFAEIVMQAGEKNNLFEVFVQVYFDIGRKHARLVNKQIKDEAKNFDLIGFDSEFVKRVKRYLRDHGGKTIKTVEETYLKTVIALLNNAIDEGKTIVEASEDIYLHINRPDFYEWQAMRIARTETTTASNYGALQGSNVTGYEMQKIWISGTDSRTRRSPPDKHDHLDMNKKKVAHDKPFEVSGEKMMFAGDRSQGATAGNIVNCRCTVAYKPKRDADGNLIEKPRQMVRL